MLLYLLEILFLIAIVWFVATQVTVPAFRGGVFFPLLRRKKLEQRLAKAREEGEQASLRGRIKDELNRARRKRDFPLLSKIK